MTELNFEQMSRQELLAYVRQHPQDTKAFHKYMDILAIAPGRVKIPVDQIDTELPKLLQAN